MSMSKFAHQTQCLNANSICSILNHKFKLMKKYLSFYSLLLLMQICFADIPLDKNGNNKTAYSDFNYLPLTLGVLFAAGILAFMYTLKKEQNETK